MKRKLIAIIPILVIIAILVVILIVTREKKPEETPLVNVSDYPVTYLQNGADLEITLDGSKTPDFAWSVVNRGEDVLEVKAKGEEKKGKITYILSPKTAGPAEVEFIRSGETDGVVYDAIRFAVPVYVNSEETGLVVSLQDGERVSGGTVVVGAATERPIYIKRDEDGDLQLEFPKGLGDWVLFDPNGEVELLSMLGDQQQTVMVPYATAAVNAGDDEITESTESKEGFAPVETTESEEGFAPAETTESAEDAAAREKRAAELYNQYLEIKRQVEAGEIQLPTEEPATEDATDAEGNYLPSSMMQELPEKSESEKKLAELAEKYKDTVSVLENGSKQTLVVAYSYDMNTVEFIDVVIDTEGQIYMSLGSDPKEEK